MTAPTLLAVELDGEVVVLDTTHARLLHLDRWTAQVWRLCDGGTAEDLGVALGARTRASRTLRSLERAGLARRDGARWVRVEARWI